MLETARTLAVLGTLALLIAGAFWIKVAREDAEDAGGAIVFSQVETASQLLTLALGLSAVAALLAVIAWISG
jgi:hypothetical protein